MNLFLQVGISGAKTEDTARQMQSTSDQNPNLPSLGDTKDEVNEFDHNIYI